MASGFSTLRPLTCWKSIFPTSRKQKTLFRCLSTITHSSPPSQTPFPLTPAGPKKIKTFPPPKSALTRCKEPVSDLHAVQIAALDPTGARTALFSKTSPEAAKVGDILLVRPRTGDPFAGVCLNIRRRGVETAILLRNELTGVSVEMWYKIYSPQVAAVEVVQRYDRRRARRARLTYLRKPKHDLRSVQNVALAYQKMRSSLRSDGVQVQEESSVKRMGGQKNKGKKKQK